MRLFPAGLALNRHDECRLIPHDARAATSKWSRQESTMGMLKGYLEAITHDRLCFVLSSLALLGVVACRQELTGVADTVDRAFLTGEAAQGLDAKGRFVLAAAAAGGFPHIDQEQAEALADAYAKVYPRLERSHFESAHGGPIDFEAARRCGRTFFARASSAPPVDSPRSLQRLVAGHYLMGYCGGDGPQFVVAVSGAAVDVRISNGSIVWPAVEGGGEFAAYPVPRRVGAIPIAPERAAEIAARFFGRRIATVPELVMPSRPEGILFARWRMTLESPVRIIGDSTREVAELSTVLIGFAMNSYDASPHASRGVGVGAPPTRWELFEFPSGAVTLQRRSDAPTAVEAVSVISIPGGIR